MSYQNITGSLSPGGHPGSYNGQDAYNDLLVTEHGDSNGNRTGKRRNHVGGSPSLTNNHEQPILMSDRKGHNGITDDGISTTLNSQEKERPLIGGDAMQSIVRRLTPLECERLQGFPDGWTDIGDWVDSKGKNHKAADSPRYRALGNSIAVGYANRQSGFWMWLMKRISAQYERSATLGSLFDGIGGFPLAWEFYNGKGSALWASEIDEFCIAVTKKHFPESEGKERTDAEIY